MSRPLSRAQLEDWRQKVKAGRKWIDSTNREILQLEMSLERMRRTVAAINKEAVVEEARFTAAETQVLVAEANANQDQIGHLLFSSNDFLRKLRRAVFKRGFRQIQLAKTDACLLSSSESEALSEFPFPAHLLRQLFPWMPLRGALRLGLTCKGMFTFYQHSLATDRRSLVLDQNNGWGFDHSTDSPFFSDDLSDLLDGASNRVILVNSAANEKYFLNTKEDVPVFSWGDRLFRNCLPRLTGLTSLTLIIGHELAANMAKLSTALAPSVPTAATTTTSSTSTSTSSSPPLSQLTTLRMICLLEKVKENEEEEKNLSAIVPLQLPALTHLTLSLHFRTIELPTEVNAIRILFGSPLLSSVLPQLSSLHLHSDQFADEAIYFLRDHLFPHVPQLLTPTTMAANLPALQLSLVLRSGEDEANLVELVEQLLLNEEEKEEMEAVTIRTRQALTSITHLQIYAIPEWPLPRFLSALIHLKMVNLSIAFSDIRSSLRTADYLATLTALSSLPHLEEIKLKSEFNSTSPPLILSRPSLSPPLPPPVLAPLRRLTIDFYAASCAENPAQFFHLTHCFPRLEKLTIEVWMMKGCGRCEYLRDLPHWTDRTAEEVKAVDEAYSKCFERLFYSLRTRSPDHLRTAIGRWAKALVKCSLILRSPESNLERRN